ncbi:hypothetical protein [Colwellia sp. E150_009]
MSKVIQVLEQMSRDANGQNEDAINNLLAAAQLDTEITTAIINKDVITLERQLDVRSDIVCMILPAEDDEDNEDNDSTEITNYHVIGF